MIIARLLLGKPYDMRGRMSHGGACKPGFTSHMTEETGTEVVMFDEAAILPVYVAEFGVGGDLAAAIAELGGAENVGGWGGGMDGMVSPPPSDAAATSHGGGGHVGGRGGGRGGRFGGSSGAGRGGGRGGRGGKGFAGGVIYLDVPFERKDEARAYGARWDPAEKKWYAPADVDPAPLLARWRTAGGGGDRPATTQCYNCGGEGHWSRDCPSELGQSRRLDEDDVCYKCGGIGHWAQHCPSRLS